jgi:hypothetical protein
MTKTYSPSEHHERMMKMASHPDEKEDRALIKKMVKPADLTGRKHGGEADGKKRAAGGALPGEKPKHKGSKAPKSQTNILIAPRGGGLPAPGMLPASPAAMAGPAGGLPSGPPRPMPAPMPPRPMAGGPGIGAMGAMPAGAKKGGKVAAHKGHKRAAGGEVMGKDVGNVTKPKTLKGYDAGACSGEGRLEKMEHYGTKAKTPLRNGGR